MSADQWGVVRRPGAAVGGSGRERRMIRYSQPPAPTETTTRAHVESVAATEGLELIPAGEFLYAIRKVPPLGQPIIMRCRVAS